MEKSKRSNSAQSCTHGVFVEPSRAFGIGRIQPHQVFFHKCLKSDRCRDDIANGNKRLLGCTCIFSAGGLQRMIQSDFEKQVAPEENNGNSEVFFL
jgi:hypothetical protein